MHLCIVGLPRHVTGSLCRRDELHRCTDLQITHHAGADWWPVVSTLARPLGLEELERSLLVWRTGSVPLPILAWILEVLMFDESNLLSEDYQVELHKWTAAWYHKVVEAGFIRPVYHPDKATVKRLHAYFTAGLSPTDAAQALFGQKH